MHGSMDIKHVESISMHDSHVDSRFHLQSGSVFDSASIVVQTDSTVAIVADYMEQRCYYVVVVDNIVGDIVVGMTPGLCYIVVVASRPSSDLVVVEDGGIEMIRVACHIDNQGYNLFAFAS